MVLTGMKKISVLIALGMLMIAPWGMAQTIYDGAKLTGKDLTEGMFEFQVVDKDLIDNTLERML